MIYEIFALTASVLGLFYVLAHILRTLHDIEIKLLQIKIDMILITACVTKSPAAHGDTEGATEWPSIFSYVLTDTNIGKGRKFRRLPEGHRGECEFVPFESVFPSTFAGDEITAAEARGAPKERERIVNIIKAERLNYPASDNVYCIAVEAINDILKEINQWIVVGLAQAIFLLWRFVTLMSGAVERNWN
jgi:hypothetical protein